MYIQNTASGKLPRNYYEIIKLTNEFNLTSLISETKYFGAYEERPAKI